MRIDVMNKPLLIALALTTLIGASPLARHAQAGNGIQRCQAPEGVTVYTDRACAAFGASAAPLSSQLLTSIARENARAEADLVANMDVASMDARGTSPGNAESLRTRP